MSLKLPSEVNNTPLKTSFKRYGSFERQYKAIPRNDSVTKELRYQEYIKQLQIDAAKLEKNKELKESIHQQSALRTLDQQKKQQELKLRMDMARNYHQQQLATHHKKLLEKRQKEEEEKQLILTVQRSLKDEQKAKIEQKRKLQKEQHDILLYKRRQENLKKQQDFWEKERERESLKPFRNPDVNRNDFYMKIINESPVLPCQKKQGTIESWVNKHCEEQQRVFDRKVEYEKKIREGNMRQVSQSLKAQIQQKETNKLFEMFEKKREAEELSRTIEFNRRKVMESEMERKKMQTVYRDELRKQTSGYYKGRQEMGHKSLKELHERRGEDTRFQGYGNNFRVGRSFTPSPSERGPVQSVGRFEKLARLIKEGRNAPFASINLQSSLNRY